MNAPLFDDLLDQLRGAPTQQLAQQLASRANGAMQAVGAALPLLLGAMHRNSQGTTGAQIAAVRARGRSPRHRSGERARQCAGRRRLRCGHRRTSFRQPAAVGGGGGRQRHRPRPGSRRHASAPARTGGDGVSRATTFSPRARPRAPALRRHRLRACGRRSTTKSARYASAARCTRHCWRYWIAIMTATSTCRISLAARCRTPGSDRRDAEARDRCSDVDEPRYTASMSPRARMSLRARLSGRCSGRAEPVTLRRAHCPCLLAAFHRGRRFGIEPLRHRRRAADAAGFQHVDLEDFLAADDAQPIARSHGPRRLRALAIDLDAAGPIACFASERVLKKRAAQSHWSSRTEAAVSVMRGRIVGIRRMTPAASG